MNIPERPEGTGLYHRCRHCHGDVFNHIRAFGRVSMRMSGEGHSFHPATFTTPTWAEPPIYICQCGAQALCMEDIAETYAVRAYNPGMGTEYVLESGKWVKADRRKYPRKRKVSV